MYDWSEKYIENVMSNTDIVDKISAGIRAASFYKYLGAVVKTAFVNSTQNYIVAAPRLSMETKWAYAKLSKAMKDVAQHYAPGVKTNIAKEELMALRKALQHKWSQEQYVRELMGNLGQFGRIPGSVQKILGGPMALAERFNRQSTFLAAFRVFRNEKKLAFDEAIEKAGDIVRQTHWDYGSSNLPSMFRGSNVAKLARTAYTFRTYPHHFVNAISYMGKRNKAAVAKSFASILAFGGIGSIPGAKTVESIAQRFGYNPRTYIKDRLNELGLDFMGEEAIYGLPAILDVDLSGSIGMELPGQRSFVSDDPYSMILEGGVDVLGVPFSYVDDTVKAGTFLYNGDVYRAIEESPVMPTVAANALQAYRMKTRGMTGRSGRPIKTDEGEQRKFTTKQAIQKGVFGFQSAKASSEYQQYKSRKAAKDYWDRKRRTILNRYRNAVHVHGFGSKQADKVLDMIMEYESNVPAFGTRIDSEVLMNAVTDRTTKKDMILKMLVK